jgi:alcohol dehydrogenase YqhD (iron-dependent ADH family)
MLPKVSFLDPTNTYTVNAFQTACGSVDILSHIFDTSYFSQQDDLYMVDTFMEGLIKTVLRFTPIAIKEPSNYEARANLMWASTWALNGFIRSGRSQLPMCHIIEHQLSAHYDITHGLGLAILTPRWMKYILDESTAAKFCQFGVNVFGIDPNLPALQVSNLAIEKLSDFFFKTLGLPSTLSEIGIDDSKFELMAESACHGGVLPGFKALNQEDIVNIFKLCL